MKKATCVQIDKRVLTNTSPFTTIYSCAFENRHSYLFLFILYKFDTIDWKKKTRRAKNHKNDATVKKLKYIEEKVMKTTIWSDCTEGLNSGHVMPFWMHCGFLVQSKLNNGALSFKTPICWKEQSLSNCQGHAVPIF